MTGPQDIERVLVAVHALTGRWLTGEEGEQVAAAGARDEILARGIVDLGWLRDAPGVWRQFTALAGAAALGGTEGEDVEVPVPSGLGQAMGREEALQLVERFAQDPTAADPFTALRRLSAGSMKP